MNKKLTYTAVSAVLLMVIAGCGDKPTAAPAAEAAPSSTAAVSGAEGTAGNGADGAEGTVTPSVAPQAEPSPSPAATAEPAKPEKQSQSIEVYFTDPQQLDLVPATVTISFGNETEKYTESFKALQTSSTADQVTLWGGIELKSLEFKDGQVTLDVHKPVEAQLGAGGEAMAVSSLAKTFFQFSEVSSIELLVDGEQVESLMGHVDLEHPITRENSGL
ncbi:GerMN domain-containing protein [Paenibacillus camerounensis]|uniref:GerMN domain-containing protein n=1 Tax=Paenibacillus camerounensis TaxID=1243663 RepID=UPI0005A738EB|nr:GerMN domain-containing protein [Paenibacillus camerounensis]